MAAGNARPLLVLNPRASRLRDPTERARLVESLDRVIAERAGERPDVVAPETIEDARTELANAVASSRPLVVVAGGDGTVREAAHDLAGSNVVLGVVPLGTANLFAASVGVPLDQAAAVAAIGSGRIRAVDLGRAQWTGSGGDRTAVFAVASGVGFDARLMAATSSGLKRRFGRYGYFAATLRMLPAVHGFATRVEVDDLSHEVEAVAVLVANAGQLIPGLLKPARPIRVDDGLLDVFVVAAGGLPGAAIGALEALARRSEGRSRSGRSIRLRGSTIRIATQPAQPIEVDGDVVGSGELAAVALPAALRVIIRPGRSTRAPAVSVVHDMQA